MNYFSLWRRNLRFLLGKQWAFGWCKKVYVVGSLENPKVFEVAEALRNKGFDVFDDWLAAAPDGDRLWQAYCRKRGYSYKQALHSPFVQTAYQFDFTHLKEADIVVLVMPCGRSAHLELGWALGHGKEGYILFPDGEPDRYDLMANLATDVCFSVEELLEVLRG